MPAGRGGVAGGRVGDSRDGRSGLVRCVHAGAGHRPDRSRARSAEGPLNGPEVDGRGAARPLGRRAWHRGRVLMDGTSRVASSVRGFHGDPGGSLTPPGGRRALPETLRVDVPATSGAGPRSSACWRSGRRRTRSRRVAAARAPCAVVLRGAGRRACAPRPRRRARRGAADRPTSSRTRCSPPSRTISARL